MKTKDDCISTGQSPMGRGEHYHIPPDAHLSHQANHSDESMQDIQSPEAGANHHHMAAIPTMAKEVPGQSPASHHEHKAAPASHGSGSAQPEHDHHAMKAADFKHRAFASILLTIPILVLSPMIQSFLGLNLHFPGDTYILWALSTVLFFYRGQPFIKGARNELGQHNPGMMTLIAMVISVAYIYSAFTVFILTRMDFFWELASLILIMLLGQRIEMNSIMGASRALEELGRLMPEEAHLIAAEGNITDVAVSTLKEGDAVLVKSGESIPIDGVVLTGRSAVNEALITGESAPVDKQTGDRVISGSINGEGAIRFRVSKTGSETFLSKIIILVREAQQSRSATQRLADKAAKWLFYIALAAGTLTFTTWLLLGGGFSFALERAVTVMVISCPHALGLAIPLVTAVFTSIAARRGLLIRNRAHFENARNINAVIFDKTGTLTEGEFGVTDLQAFGISEEETLSLAYAVEFQSVHPIAQGIVREAQRRNIPLLDVQDYQVMPAGARRQE